MEVCSRICYVLLKGLLQASTCCGKSKSACFGPPCSIIQIEISLLEVSRSQCKRKRPDERNMKWSNREGFLQCTNSDAIMVWEQTQPWSADFAHSFPFQTLLELLIHKGRQVKTISFHSQTGDQQRFTLPIDYLGFIVVVLLKRNFSVKTWLVRRCTFIILLNPLSGQRALAARVTNFCKIRIMWTTPLIF